MKQITLEQLSVGMTALMEVGAPVRQWVRMFRGGAQRWLTPVRYIPSSVLIEPESLRPLVVVRIAQLTLPYAVVSLHNGEHRVKLWLDTREVQLFTISD